MRESRFLATRPSKKDALRIAYKKGYRVIDGKVYSPHRKDPLKLSPNSAGYLHFSVKVKWWSITIPVHRLVAFQKYGSAMFMFGIVVRHLDDNRLNNMPGNISLGTHKQNMNDVPRAKRLKRAIHASSFIRKFDDETIEKIRELHRETRSYKKVMAKYGIESKGTLHHILNNDYQTPA